MNILLILGIVCLFISGISTGSFVTGTQQRGNYYSETSKDRTSRNKIGVYFLIGGVVLLAIYGVMYAFS